MECGTRANTWRREGGLAFFGVGWYRFINNWDAKASVEEKSCKDVIYGRHVCISLKRHFGSSF